MVLTGKPFFYWDRAGAIRSEDARFSVLGRFFLPENLYLDLSGPKIARQKLPVLVPP